MEEVDYKNFKAIGYSDYDNYNQIYLSIPGVEGTYLSPNKIGSSLPYWKVVDFEPDCFIVKKLEDSELMKKLSEKSKRISEKQNNFEKSLVYF